MAPTSVFSSERLTSSDAFANERRKLAGPRRYPNDLDRSKRRPKVRPAAAAPPAARPVGGWQVGKLNKAGKRLRGRVRMSLGLRPQGARSAETSEHCTSPASLTGQTDFSQARLGENIPRRRPLRAIGAIWLLQRRTKSSDFAKTTPGLSFGARPRTGLSFGAPPRTGLSFGAPPRTGLSFGAPPRTGLSFGAPPRTGLSFGAPPPKGSAAGFAPFEPCALFVVRSLGAPGQKRGGGCSGVAARLPEGCPNPLRLQRRRARGAVGGHVVGSSPSAPARPFRRSTRTRPYARPAGSAQAGAGLRLACLRCRRVSALPIFEAAAAILAAASRNSRARAFRSEPTRRRE